MAVVLPRALSGASSLEKAAQVVVEAFPTVARVAVWATDPVTGVRRLLAGDSPPDDGRGEAAVATAGCGITIELIGGPDDDLAAAAMALAVVADRLAAEADAVRVRRQLEATERLGGTGSYDWDAATGHLEWSAELYRIYGEEPGAFEPTYETILERVHPEDRDRIQALHEEAMETATGFQTEERILRPDGSVRTLLTNGLVVTDQNGHPIGMHGVCRDVTEERAVSDLARSASLRFKTLVQAAPDAIVVVDHEGRIRSVNPQAERLFGYDTATLTSMSVDELVPDASRALHARLRAGFAAEPAVRSMAAGTDLQARRGDGTPVAVDIALTPLEGEIEGSVAAFVRDATPRRQAEQARRRLAEADMRRKQALELNDNVVQGLVALLWELDEHDEIPETARQRAERTLAAARRIMSDLLTALPDDRGMLVRTSQLSEDTPSRRYEPDVDAPDDAVRVVVADDAAPLRTLLRLRLRRLPGVTVVGEAADGHQAIELCEEHRPEVVLLDLAMPALDGLEAAEEIRRRSPTTRIWVLSGYPEDVMRERALAAGADEYFEKTNRLDALCDAMATVAADPANRPRTA